MKKSRVFVDGALIGLVENPRDLVSGLRRMRRKGEIPTEINVSLKEYNGDVIIHTDRGRARRPLIVLEKGKPLITPDDIAKLKDGLIPFDDMVKRGLIEFIDAEEEEDLYIAIHERGDHPRAHPPRRSTPPSSWASPRPMSPSPSTMQAPG